MKFCIYNAQTVVQDHPLEPALKIRISPEVLQKLKEKHHVDEREVSQCFMNRDGDFLEDLRPEHLTKPLTEWFVAETNKRRRLKVVFVQVGNDIDLKSCYDADEESIAIYDANAY